MRWLWYLVIGICLLYSCTNTKPYTKYVGGIQINEADQVQWAKTIKAAGMNLVQVTAYAKQGNWNTDHLWWEDSDTTNIIREIRAVKSQGVHVIMVLRVALQHEGYDNKFLWHGMIFPQDEKLREEWFYRYKYFVEMWSKICEREGVEILAVASEMNALTATERIDSLPNLLEYFSNKEKQVNHMSKILKFEETLQAENLWVRGFENYDDPKQYIRDKVDAQKSWSNIVCHEGQSDSIQLINSDRQYFENTWRDIIKNARQYYSGTLTLAANFDNYNEVTFWDELDCIGINAYFPLRQLKPQRPTPDSLKNELINGWDSILNVVDTFKVKQNIPDHPIFFTEIGYTPKQDCTVEPWEGFGFSHISNTAIDTLLIWDKAPIDKSERVMAIDALREVVQNREYPLLGLSYWKMTSHFYHTGYEPFMLLIDSIEVDRLQGSLSEFLN